MDKIQNWNEFYNKNFNKISKEEIDNEKMYEKTYNNHYIKSKNNICLLIGASGSGKTNSIIDFIFKTKLPNNDIPFYSLTYFTSSTSDEGLLKLLKEILPSVILIDDLNKLPNIEDYKNNNSDYNKKLKNIIIFDDIANLNKKQKDILNIWSNSGRKLYSHMFFISQNYFDITPTVRRNANYIFLYKSSDLSMIKQILKKHNIYNIDMDLLIEWYINSTQDKGQFLMLDLNGDSPIKIRSNFLNKLY